MSKAKKYLLLASGIVLLVWGAVCAYFAISHITDITKVYDMGNWISSNFEVSDITFANTIAQMVVAFLASSAIVSIAFGAFTIRFSFYSSSEFEEKRSIAITMAALAFIVVNPIIAALFLVAALLKDKNYVPQAPTLAVDTLEDKLKKLVDLKEKNLISEEEYNKLRNNILNS